MLVSAHSGVPTTHPQPPVVLLRGCAVGGSRPAAAAASLPVSSVILQPALAGPTMKIAGRAATIVPPEASRVIWQRPSAPAVAATVVSPLAPSGVSKTTWRAAAAPGAA